MHAFVAAGLSGAIVSCLATPSFLHFIRELRLASTFRIAPASFSVSLLVGSALVSAPLGAHVFSETLWPSYTYGEAALFLPLAFSAIWKYSRRS